MLALPLQARKFAFHAVQAFYQLNEFQECFYGKQIFETITSEFFEGGKVQEKHEIRFRYVKHCQSFVFVTQINIIISLATEPYSKLLHTNICSM